jgi:hypothetical protein
MRVKTIRLILILILCAALLSIASACSVVSESAGASGALVVSEIVASNKRSLVDDALGTPDWIELYNSGTSALDISGYGISDNLKKLHKYVVPEGTVIGAGEYLVLYAMDAGDTASDSSAYCMGFGLSKSGDFVFVTDSYYGMVAQIELPSLYTDVSYAIKSDGTYGYCSVPTPGEANTEDIYSTLDEVFAAQNLESFVISEVMPNEDGTGYKWVEFYNSGSTAVQLENYCLSDDINKPLKWQFSSGAVGAGEYVCIYLSGLGSEAQDGVHTSFKLSKEDTVLILSDLQGNAMDRIEWESPVPKGVSVVKDASGAAVYTAFPSFEAANSDKTFAELTLNVMDTTDPVHINEALKGNTLSITDEDGERSDWVELKNFSNAPVSVHGCFLSDDADDLYKWALPDLTIEAGGYLVVFLDGKDRTDGELHASFGLSDEETELFFTSIDGMRSESISFAGIEKDNISVGLDENWNIRYYAAPTPGYENAHGFETADQIGCFDNTGVFISEVSAVSEAKSDENDWIELCNGSDEDISLAGWIISDDPDEPAKYTITDRTIEAGGYLVIECTSHATRQTDLTAPFGISPAGETIVLYDASGVLVDAFETGSLSLDVTSGRIESDTSVARVFFENTTKGKENDDDVSVGKSPQPVLSETGLYHTESFTVTITCSNPNAVIYYTTDGEEPNTRDNTYTGPITISQNTPLRAVSYVSGKLKSDVATANYLFEDPHTVPVVCITGDPDDIDAVLSVTDKWKKVERAAYISYYEEDGSLGTSFPAGIKPKGAGTLVYAQKSLSINLRAAYGQSSVTYPFWDDYEFDTFASLVVRNGGQDWATARIRDSFASALVEGMYIDNAATRPVAVYINGEYNGLYDLNEDQNSEFLVTHYGVDGDTANIIRRNSGEIKGENDDFKRVRTFAKNKNLSDEALFEEFSQWVDVEYFTDYFIAETYMCNSDMFNQKYWRTTDYAVKWRPIFYDLDFAFKSYSRDIIGHFFSADGVPSADGSLTYFEIYIGLRKNAAWREYCVERYVEVIETYFNPERATAILDAMVEEMRPEMERQIAKWRKPSSMAAWEEEIERLRTYVERRPEYALENLRKNFGLTQDEMDALIAKYSTGTAN